MVSYQRIKIRPTTFTQYRQITRDYIIPEIGQLLIRDLRPDHIQHLYNKKLSEGLGIRSVKTIHSVLHNALNQAVKLGILNRNPAKATSPPNPTQKEMKFYDQTQVHQLLISAKLTEDRYHALFKLAVTTGMRQGELLGLRWSDLDLQTGTLRVSRQLKRRKGGGFRFAPPKSKAGIRTLVIGSDTMKILREHQRILHRDMLEAGEKWKEHNLIFPSLVGTPPSQANSSSGLSWLIKHAGLPEIRFHDLRHTAASLMLNNGIPLIVVSRRLGHSQPSITLNVYGHMSHQFTEKWQT